MTAIDLRELRKYSLFNNQNEMDDTIRKTVDEIRGIVRDSVVDVLWTIGAASLRVPGISFMKQQTIANKAGYSRWAVNKALKELERLGVIDSVRTQTAAGRPSVKVYRIKPFNADALHQSLTAIYGDKLRNGEGLRLISEFEPYGGEAENQKINTDIEQSENIQPEEDSEEKTEDKDTETATEKTQDSHKAAQLDDSFIPRSIVPEDFIRTVRPFFPAAKIYRLWGMVRLVMKRNDLQAVTDDVISSAIEGFKNTVFMHKARKIKKTFDQYLYGVLSCKLAAVRRREAEEERERAGIGDWSPLQVNWLDV